MGEVRAGATEGRPDPELADAIEAYLKITRGDVRQALALSVADAIAVTRLVSTGYARLRQPKRRWLGRGEDREA